MPNKLTPLYSKNDYKEENYLIVRTVCLNTQLPPIVMVQYVSTSVRSVREYASALRNERSSATIRALTQKKRNLFT